MERNRNIKLAFVMVAQMVLFATSQKHERSTCENVARSAPHPASVRAHDAEKINSPEDDTATGSWQWVPNSPVNYPYVMPPPTMMPMYSFFPMPMWIPPAGFPTSPSSVQVPSTRASHNHATGNHHKKHRPTANSTQKHKTSKNAHHHEDKVVEETSNSKPIKNVQTAISKNSQHEDRVNEQASSKPVKNVHTPMSKSSHPEDKINEQANSKPVKTIHSTIPTTVDSNSAKISGTKPESRQNVNKGSATQKVHINSVGM